MPRTGSTGLPGKGSNNSEQIANLWPPPLMTNLHHAPAARGARATRAGSGGARRERESSGGGRRERGGDRRGAERTKQSAVRSKCGAWNAICGARRARARQRVLSRPGGCYIAGGARSASHPSRLHRGRSHPARRAARSRFGRRRGGVAPFPPFFVLVRCATEEMYTPQQHETTEVVYGRTGGGISE